MFGDLLGYSLGAQASPALCHPASRSGEEARSCFIPFRRDGWFPEVLAAFDEMNSTGFDLMRHSPMYAAWSQVAPVARRRILRPARWRHEGSRVGRLGLDRRASGDTARAHPLRHLLFPPARRGGRRIPRLTRKRGRGGSTPTSLRYADRRCYRWRRSFPVATVVSPEEENPVNSYHGSVYVERP